MSDIFYPERIQSSNDRHCIDGRTDSHGEAAKHSETRRWHNEQSSFAGPDSVQGTDSSVRKENTSPRRSARQRLSTTMQIQGHTVLRVNNYRVEGHCYTFDDHQEDAPKEPKKRDYKPNGASLVRTVRPPRPHEISLKRHNQSVRDALASKEDLRNSFLASKLDILEEFCEPKVLKKLAGFEIRKEASKFEAPKQPKMIQKAILRPYQLKGLEFMVGMHQKNLAMILGDEMGLGKTLQTISLLCYLKETEGISGPSLIICPLSVLSSWCNELEKWAPSLNYIRLHASNPEEQIRQKRELIENVTEYDVLVTTYEMAKAPTLVTLFQKVHFHYLVLDEGHKIKGHETIISQTVRKFHAGNKLLLTGTPLQNNLFELWSLLNFLYPEVFTLPDPFASHFDLTENIVDKAFLARTQKLLELFMLRRLKQEVEKLIPPKLETKVYCPLSKSQTFWYKAVLMKDVSSLAKMDSSENDESKTGNHNLLRNLFMQLRKCSNHPFLFDGAETDPNTTTLEELVGSSGKLAVLDMLLRSLFQKGNRVVLFTQFTKLLDLIEDYCLMRGWKTCRLDGSTSRARRSYLINRFNEANSPYFLFLMSTRSGGMGLNLQTADTCILFDSDWNPQSDIQAMARVHRIGQTKTVHVYRLVTAGTVEERMIERSEKKLLLEMVNQETKGLFDSNDVSTGLSAGELLADIKFGCGAVFGDSSDNLLPSQEEIASITDRARKESDSVGKLTGGISKTAKTFDASKEFSKSQCFGGTDFSEIRKKQEVEEKRQIPKNLAGIAHLWKEVKGLENKKRERKSRILQVDGVGSGYGKSFVPILAANNYTFGGESSVFDRELKGDKKSKFEVHKKTKKEPSFESDDYCIVCGDGGSLVCCSQCPNTVHLSCVGLRTEKEFFSCPHHRCVMCGKNRSDAGGLLYPCHACPNSYCEDHLPKEGVTFLDEGVERFEKLGFCSTKHNVYINCSKVCEEYAKQEYGYKPSVSKRGVCPEPMDLSAHFGASYDLKESASAVEADKTESYGRGKRSSRAGCSNTGCRTSCEKRMKVENAIAIEKTPIASRAILESNVPKSVLSSSTAPTMLEISSDSSTASISIHSLSPSKMAGKSRSDVDLSPAKSAVATHSISGVSSTLPGINAENAIELD